MQPSLLLREGKIDEAREAVKHMPTAPRYHRDLLEACLGLRPSAEADQQAQEAETTPPSAPDAELLYYQGTLFADCGKRQAAVRMLQGAIDQNYCSYQQLELDPLLRKLRYSPSYDKLLKSAKECQQAATSGQQTPPVQ